MENSDIINATDIESFFAKIYANKEVNAKILNHTKSMIQVTFDEMYTITYDIKSECVTPCNAIDELVRNSIWHVPIEVMR